MNSGRRPALLSVDLEDYRSIRMRDHGHAAPTVDPSEIRRQIELVLDLFDSIRASATFFCVGRLARDLPAGVWHEIAARHTLGAHGFDHERVGRLGASRFAADLARTKSVLEDAGGADVVSYRAPYFSCDRCDPWFGESLARVGFRIDSSRRITWPPRGFRGVMELPGSGGDVVEVPFPSLGAGAARVTVIGGTYFRLLPLGVIRVLLAGAERRGFVPMVYLHPYDVDPDAVPLDPRGVRRAWALRAGDWLRRAGRVSAAAKLRALAGTYAFRPVESVLHEAASP